MASEPEPANAEEEKKASDNDSEERPQEDPIKLYRVHEKYDNVETEFKLLCKGEPVNLLVRPYGNESTKVIMTVTGTKARKE